MNKYLLTVPLLACCALSAQMQKTPCPQDAPYVYVPPDAPIESAPMTGKYPAAYNAPANVSINRNYDIYGDISYLYWFVYQEGMDLAVTGYFEGDIANPSNTNGKVIFQDSEYSSGFKIGLGMNLNYDDWVADLEYTYLRQSNRYNSPAAPAHGDNDGLYIMSGWFSENFYSIGMSPQQFDTKWSFGLDWLDLMFKRPYYQGRKLIITPSAGLRASWIRESLELTGKNLSTYDSHNSALSDFSRNFSNSWAIGPRGVVAAQWIFDLGFRIQGDLGASVLFTQYTTIFHKETGVDSPNSIKISDYNVLRPMVEANLGAGWGRYLQDHRYHIDFSATYDFNYLWDQNMMKYLLMMNGSGRGGSPLGLFLHGLTLRGRFDF